MLTFLPPDSPVGWPHVIGKTTSSRTLVLHPCVVFQRSVRWACPTWALRTPPPPHVPPRVPEPARPATTCLRDLRVFDSVPYSCPACLFLAFLDMPFRIVLSNATWKYLPGLGWDFGDSFLWSGGGCADIPAVLGGSLCLLPSSGFLGTVALFSA